MRHPVQRRSESRAPISVEMPITISSAIPVPISFAIISITGDPCHELPRSPAIDMYCSCIYHLPGAMDPRYTLQRQSVGAQVLDLIIFVFQPRDLDVDVLLVLVVGRTVSCCCPPPRPPALSPPCSRVNIRSNTIISDTFSIHVHARHLVTDQKKRAPETGERVPHYPRSLLDQTSTSQYQFPG